MLVSVAWILTTALCLWLGAWVIERGRRPDNIGPVQLLVLCLVQARAAGMMARDCYSAVVERLERWPEHQERARRETV
jgi:hypothetical protein